MRPRDTVASRVLVTGAAGFLGRAVVEALRIDGFDVLAASRRELDFDSPRWPELAPCSAIVHLASAVDHSVSADPAVFRSTNQEGVARLAGLAKGWKARLVLASSVFVHGDTEKIDQETPVAPLTPYARAKAEAEDILERSGVRWTILRYAGIYGLGGPGHLSLNRSIETALARRPPVLTGNGEARRNYIYVHDAAAAVVEVLRGEVGGRHIVASAQPLTVAEMLEMIVSVLWSEGHVDRRPGGTARDMIAVPSPRLRPGRPFRETLADVRRRAAEASRC